MKVRIQLPNGVELTTEDCYSASEEEVINDMVVSVHGMTMYAFICTEVNTYINKTNAAITYDTAKEAYLGHYVHLPKKIMEQSIIVFVNE